jgi:peptide deformylase
MIKPIIIYGDPVLRKICKPYFVGTNLKETIQDLWDTMYNADGVGIAAPQVGLSTRLFVIDLSDQEWKQVFINPKITKTFGEHTYIEESCLSLPGISDVITRHDEIVIEYYDENWLYLREEYKGIRSRVIQHEYDHLEGKLWIDRAQPSNALLEKLQILKES